MKGCVHAVEGWQLHLPHPSWQGEGKHRLIMGFQQTGECQEFLTGSECLLSWLNFGCCCCETGNFIIYLWCSYFVMSFFRDALVHLGQNSENELLRRSWGGGSWPREMLTWDASAGEP